MKKYLLIIFVGLALIANGWDGLRLGWTAGDAPERINLAELESGKQPASTYIELGEHYRLTSHIVYSVLKRKKSTVDAQSTVSYAFMPVLSADLIQQVVTQSKARGELQLPASLAMLIQTSEFGKRGELESYARDSALLDARKQARGLLINGVGGLSDEHRDMLQRDFPGIDFSRILILELDRTPASGAELFLLFAGGLALLALGLGLLIKHFKTRKPTAAQA